jgi:hypothetical protein
LLVPLLGLLLCCPSLLVVPVVPSLMAPGLDYPWLLLRVSAGLVRPNLTWVEGRCFVVTPTALLL